MPVGKLNTMLHRRLLVLPSDHQGRGKERRLSVIEVYQLALFDRVARHVPTLPLARLIVERLLVPGPSEHFTMGDGRTAHEKLSFKTSAKVLARIAEDLDEAPHYYLDRGRPERILFIGKEEFWVGEWPSSPPEALSADDNGIDLAMINLTRLFTELDDAMLGTKPRPEAPEPRR
jgi:hypothetical protein